MCFERMLDPTEEGKEARRLLEQRQRPIAGGSGQEFWKIRIDMGADFTVRNLQDDSRIDTDPEGINKALAETPQMIIFYGRAEVIARVLVDRAKARLELHEAELYKTTPGRVEAEGRKPTVDAIRSSIVLDPTRQELHRELLESEHNQAVLIVGKQGMVHKKDTAIEIARNMRAEMDYDLKVGKERLVSMYNKGEGGKE